MDYNPFLEDMLQIYLMNEPMKNILPALTQEEFKNILHLLMSQDSECRVLGQTLAKHYGFLHKFIVTEKYIYPITDLIEINRWITYEEGYEWYLSSNNCRGIL